MVLTVRRPAGALRWRWAAVALMALLWVSPFCAASASLLSVRVAHHMVAMLLLAPALALGWPKVHIGDMTGWAIVAAISLSAWFVPAAYSFAWEWAAGYWVLQLAMVGAAWQFWSNWFHPAAEGRPLVMAGTPALLAMVMGFVGALLTFAPRPLYAEHIFTTVQFDVSALWDQQLAGLLMWTIGMVPMAVLAFVRLGKMAGATGERAAC
nr:cytochrome c oxidase assembly protein [Blastomonas sp. AAP53]